MTGIQPTTYSISAHASSVGDATAEIGDELVAFDASWPAGASTLPGPAELLAAALAACILKSLNRAAHMLDFRFTSADVDVVARRQDVPPLFVELTYELRITTFEDDHLVDLMHHNIRKFGTVYNTLALACTVSGSVVAVRPLAVL